MRRNSSPGALRERLPSERRADRRVKIGTLPGQDVERLLQSGAEHVQRRRERLPAEHHTIKDVREIGVRTGILFHEQGLRQRSRL